ADEDDEAQDLDKEYLARADRRHHRQGLHAQLLSWMYFWTAAWAPASSLVSMTFSATSRVSRVTSDLSWTRLAFFSRAISAIARSDSALASAWAFAIEAWADARASFRRAWVLSYPSLSTLAKWASYSFVI